MRFPIRCILWLIVLVLVGAPAAVLLLAVDKTAAVSESRRISFEDLRRAQALAARYDPRHMRPDEETTLTATVADLDTAIGAGLAGLKQIRARASADRAGVAIVATLELPVPDNPIGRYVNLQLGIAASDRGLGFNRFSAGALILPPQIVRPLLRLALDLVTQSDNGEAMLESVKLVRIAGDRVTIVYQPPEDLAGGFEDAARLALAAADPAKVRVYYSLLHQTAIRERVAPQSLAPYLGAVFQLAEQRSAINEPIAENEAAIVALAMYFGDLRLERVAGEVRTGALKSIVPRVDRILLSSRRDWVQHFVVSAGLTVAAGKGIADVIGVAKEVMDSDGPSGFSFTDIGADRAGVRFAETAIASPESARALQRALAVPIGEATFFPRVDDLPEGLSEAEFRRSYGDITSVAFGRMIAEIDRRIGAIALYR